MKKNVIEIEDLTVSYTDRPVLWDVDLTIEEQTLTAIVGPNGAGKSTLIKAALGLIKPLAGTTLFFQKSYKETFKRIGYIPQKEAVNWDFPATVLDVVEMGRYGQIGWFKRVSKKEKELAKAALNQMGMSDFAHRHISELSGGQQQRVFLARALAQNADIYFMDEPLAGIDKKTEKVIIDTLHQLKAAGKTIVVVHHDLNTVAEYFDNVVLLNKEVVAHGPVKTTFTPENIDKAFSSSMQVDGASL